MHDLRIYISHGREGDSFPYAVLTTFNRSLGETGNLSPTGCVIHTKQKTPFQVPNVIKLREISNLQLNKRKQNVILSVTKNLRISIKQRFFVTSFLRMTYFSYLNDIVRVPL